MEILIPLFETKTKLTSEGWETLFTEIKKTSFYSPVLVNTFQKEVNPKTVVTEPYDEVPNDKVPKYFIGGQVKDKQSLYLTLMRDRSKGLMLQLSSWLPQRLRLPHLYSDPLLADSPPTLGEIEKDIGKTDFHRPLITLLPPKYPNILPDIRFWSNNLSGDENISWAFDEFIPGAFTRFRAFAQVSSQKMGQLLKVG